MFCDYYGVNMEADIAFLEGKAVNGAQVQRSLESFGHSCVSFASGRELMASVRKKTFSLYILTAPQTDVDFEQLVQWLRNTLGARVPILISAPFADEQFMVRILSAGADRCVLRYVGANELVAHANALLRRAYLELGDGSAHRFEVGPYLFDVRRKIVTYKGRPLCASAREFKLALYLFRHMGTLVPRDFLETFIWGKPISPCSRALDAHMSRMRTRFYLRQGSAYSLISVYSHGFKLIPNGRVNCSQACRELEPRLGDEAMLYGGRIQTNLSAELGAAH